MTPEEFTILLERRIDLTRQVLDSKAKEYAPGADRLHNFKRAAAVNNTTPVLAAWSFATKHLVSILDMIEAPDQYTYGQWDEKLGDMINYLILMEACINEIGPVKRRFDLPPEQTDRA